MQIPTSARPPAAALVRRIRRALLTWYAAEHRHFPWRGTRDPWAVLVSEVMLQQTQVSRVTDRFPAFMAAFPTAAATVGAGDAAVLAAWSGLGYNRRALSLRQAALAVVRDGWPRDVEGLERLPGVGPYTARAVAALAFGQPVGAVDTNVRRWLVRRLPLSPEASPRELQSWADALAAPAAGPDEAAAWMHASMEFGARICAARAPRCGACPIATGCPSRGRATRVPVAGQAPFAGSARAARGAVLRALATAPEHALPRQQLSAETNELDLDDVLGGLERDGLAHAAGGVVRLGPAEGGPPAATIEP